MEGAIRGGEAPTLRALPGQGLDRSVWIVLEPGCLAAKTPGNDCWISLDFLGFSRPNRDLSKGYTRFSLENFSSRFLPGFRGAEAQTNRGIEGAGLFIAQAYLNFRFSGRNCRQRLWSEPTRSEGALTAAAS